MGRQPAVDPDHPLRIAHLFPGSMGLYGDRGNVIALKRRCAWRDIPYEVEEIRPGQRCDLGRFDIVFVGGGADRDQEVIAAELQKIGAGAMSDAVEDGLVVLGVCGGYQLLGRAYVTADGQALPGLGVLAVETRSGTGRLVGPVEIDAGMEFGGILAGFENHGGRTYLLDGATPLGRVLRGFGNNGTDGNEGCVYRNCFGTYLHGPVLPQNPGFTDALIARAIERRTGRPAELAAIQDDEELAARAAAVRQAEQGRSLLSRLGLEF